MAQNLANAEGIVADDNYPKGYKIVDDVTDVNAHINQDIIQFFQKLMKEADINPNNIDDNENNGYQFIEALIKSFKQNNSANKPAGLLANNTTAGLCELATSEQTKNGTDTESHEGINYPLVVIPSCLKTYTNRVEYKLITMSASDWNMVLDETKTIAHNLSWPSFVFEGIKSSVKITNVRVSVTITFPDETISKEFTDSGQGFIDSIDDTNIILRRLTGGYFDNEGILNYITAIYVLITYIP